MAIRRKNIHSLIAVDHMFDTCLRSAIHSEAILPIQEVQTVQIHLLKADAAILKNVAFFNRKRRIDDPASDEEGHNCTGNEPTENPDLPRAFGHKLERC